MKSYTVDYKLKDDNIIRLAIINTCKNKHKKNGRETRKYKEAQFILSNLESYVQKTKSIIFDSEKVMKLELKGEDVNYDDYEAVFIPSEQTVFTIKDENSGKIREISSVPIFPDQIIHQLIVMCGQEGFSKGMYHHSYGSLPNKGVHSGKKYIKKYISRSIHNNPTNVKYVAQLDITKCYPNIPHDYLKALLRKKFRGHLYLWFCNRVIDGYSDFENKGLPIGYYTSQWFCNFVLSPLDYFIKDNLGVKFYMRYMDDMVLFGRNKKLLHKQVRAIINFMNSIGMTIKKNWQVFRFDYIAKNEKRKGRALDVLGFRFFRDKIILRKRLSLKIMRQARRLKRLGRKIKPKDAMSFMARIGWLRHCNSKNLYAKYVKPNVNIRKLKGLIRNESRKHNKTYCTV